MVPHHPTLLLYLIMAKKVKMAVKIANLLEQGIEKGENGT